MVEASNSLKIKAYNNNNKNIQSSQVVAQVQVLELELLVSQEVVVVVIKVLGFECPHQIVIMVMNTIIIMVANTKWPLTRAGGPRCQLLIKPVVAVILIAIHHPQPR